MKKTSLERRLNLITREISFLLVICMLMLPVGLSISASEFLEGEDSKKTTSIVVATTDIKQGTKFTETNVELRDVEGVTVPANVVSSLEDVIGKYAAFAVYQDEYIYTELLAESKNDQKQLNDYVNIGDYVKPNTKMDVTAKIQKVITENPKRTIYFPDGEYLISSSLRTFGSSSKSVSFIFSDGAVLKADAKKWTVRNGCEALICMGVNDGTNTEVNKSNVAYENISVGTYYSIQGGTLDCNGVACGISLDGGRETLVKNVNIKNAPKGIRIGIGVNNKSSDMDIDDVIIQCDGSAGSIGMELLGLDNTISNVKIYDAQTGISFPQFEYKGMRHNSGGNVFRNVHIYYTHTSTEIDYSQTVGIDESWHGNFYYNCYVENYALAYRIYSVKGIVDSCTARWTTSNGGDKIAFQTLADTPIRTFFSCVRADFFDSSTNNKFFSKTNGTGGFESPIVDRGNCSFDADVRYKVTPID